MHVRCVRMCTLHCCPCAYKHIFSYRCQVCEKRFSRSDHLAKHLKVHRRDRLYTYLATLGYNTPSRRGRLSQSILSNEAVKSFIQKENISLWQVQWRSLWSSSSKHEECGIPQCKGSELFPRILLSFTHNVSWHLAVPPFRKCIFVSRSFPKDSSQIVQNFPFNFHCMSEERIVFSTYVR